MNKLSSSTLTRTVCVLSGPKNKSEIDMIKNFSTIILLVLLSPALQAQKIIRALDNHNSKAADLVIFALGMENPLKLGTVDAQGMLSVNLEEIQIPELTDEVKDMYFTELRNVFRFGCGGRDDFGKQGNIPALRGGNIALWDGNEWTGSIFLVSDTELKSWLEDEGYNSAIKATFWDIVYAGEDVKLNLNCKNEIGLESGNVEVIYTYSLDLKKGFNWVEYTIEEVYNTKPEETASFPSKVKISNLSNPEIMKWMANYFF
jgi:hypothetical protein